MDSGLPHYSTNVINTSAASSYHSQSPHHQLQPGSSLPQTLPPLQPSNLVMQQPYSSYPHTPRTPATPNSTSSANAMASYPPPPPQNGGRSAYPGMMNNPNPYQHQQQQQQSYATSSSMLPQSTTAPTHPQPIAPVPSAAGRAPPVLRPMPAGGVMPQPGISSPYAQSPLMPQPPMLPDGEQPTHVVGSQGRRGILPSAPGRPAAPAAGTGVATKNQIPQKDADGKFPCPHCTKTYLHAKHLKRHLLRHTGDRPYMCVLCRDTFSRSDILKRHFQKCSIRRGNPTGASHLSHPQAHVKKNAQAQAKAMGAEGGDMNHINGMGNMPDANGMVHPFGLISTPDGMSNVANEQSQLSRSSSIIKLEPGRDRRNMAGLTDAPPHQPYNGEVQNNGMGSNLNPQMANYSMAQNQGNLPMFAGQDSGASWSQMFQAGATSQSSNEQYTTAPNDGQTQTAIKLEPNVATAIPAGVPGSSTPPDLSSLPTWGVPSDPLSRNTSLQHLSDKIINFLRASAPASTDLVQQLFTIDNLQDMIQKYNHFHSHFSILHPATFSVLDVHVGLAAAICLVGGCYSDRMSAAYIRDAMTSLKTSLVTSSRMFASVSAGGAGSEYETFGSKQDIEELQALVLVEILFTWHGTPLQREQARRSFPLLAALARKVGLLQVSSNASLYSRTHQPDFDIRTFDPVEFSWPQWVAQETRCRLMYIIFLCDAVFGLYFNAPPAFGSFEIELPLPADDAAWEASDATECAEALGLRGRDAVAVRNPDGTQRCSQPQMHYVLKALLHPLHHVQPGSTNLFGKFIIIHALLAFMRRVQLDESARAAMSASSTPVPQNAWFAGIQTGGSMTPNTRATPDLMGDVLEPQIAKQLNIALDKFKANWDIDMSAQFPPSVPAHPRRYGFSKDGIHFYYLALHMLKHTRAEQLQMAPDLRFVQVMTILKSVRNWVLTDGAARGEEPGSVCEIDDKYATSYLTLELADIFKPMANMATSSSAIPGRVY